VALGTFDSHTHPIFGGWIKLAGDNGGALCPQKILIDKLPDDVGVRWTIRLTESSYTPDMLREQIAELKGFLKDKNAPFGVDLLIPQVGGSARKTK
jgi:hypothetical protein